MLVAKCRAFVFKNPKLTAIIVGILFIFGNLIIANNIRKDGKRYVFWSDALGYYAYLPATFIHHDLLGCSYDVSTCFKLGKDEPHRIFKYTSGVAILESPFFFIALGVSYFTETNPDGLSDTFQFFITMSTLFYCFMGLLLMFLILLKFVRARSALISVIIIYLGTNLYYYSVGESGMSHAYSFFTISWFIWSLLNFLEKPTWKNSTQMGFAFGLSIIIRPTNIFIILAPIFFNLTKFKEIPSRIKLFISLPQTYLAGLFALLAMLPQLIYWKLQSGKFFFFSYQGESFSSWKNPHIFDVLFGSISGLFIYSPLLFLFIPGLYFLWKRTTIMNSIAVLFIFSLITYANASWWMPTFDCSFGHRAFIEYYPILLIPIAFSVEAIFKKWKAVLFTTVVFLFFFINIRMSYLYKKHPCWCHERELGYQWNYKNVAYVFRVVFFIDPRPRYDFRIIDTRKPWCQECNE